MTSYNTGNPIGSKDPRDLYDNAENLDAAVNDTANDTWSDRLGRSRKTMSGMERQFDAAENYRETTFVSTQADKQNRFNTFIASSGYQFLGDYAADIEITEYNQIVRDSNGEFWRLSGEVELPYTTTGAGLPEDDSFTPLGDAVLRQELSQGNGAALVGFEGGNVLDALKERVVFSNVGLTVKIPSDYATLQGAIVSLMDYKMGVGEIIDLVIESGHQPLTGISVKNGDYSHFRVSSEDAEVMLHSDFGVTNHFISAEYASAPILNCLVNGNNGSAYACYQIHNNSRGFVTEGSGGKYFWGDGLAVRYGSSVYAEGSIFTNNAVNGTTSSNIHSLSSFVHADNSVATDSGYYGVQATSGGFLGFRGGDASRAHTLGMRARDEGRIDAEGGKANDCGGTGLRLFFNGDINFRQGEANNCEEGVVATHGSRITANDATFNNSRGVGVLLDMVSSGILTGAVINDSGLRGLEIIAGSTATASTVEIKRSKSIGVRVHRSSILNAMLANISESSQNGVSIESGSLANLSEATIVDNGTSGISCNASKVDADKATIKNNTIGVLVTDGGSVNVADADCQNNTQRGLYAYLGGTISAHNTLAQKTPGEDSFGSINSDIVVLQGGIIFAHGAVGGVNSNAVVNAVEERGTIYRDV